MSFTFVVVSKCGICFLPLDLEVNFEDYGKILKVFFSTLNLA